MWRTQTVEKRTYGGAGIFNRAPHYERALTSQTGGSGSLLLIYCHGAGLEMRKERVLSLRSFTAVSDNMLFFLSHKWKRSLILGYTREPALLSQPSSHLLKVLAGFMLKLSAFFSYQTLLNGIAISDLMTGQVNKGKVNE